MPCMTGPNETWQRIHQAFDPMQPASAAIREPRRRYNPLSERVVPRLRLPIPHQKLALAGGIGSGKSTELLETAASLKDDKIVLLIDLWRHFESTVADPGAIDHVQPAELIALLGLAVLRAGTDLLSHPWEGRDRALQSAIAGIQGTGPSEADRARVDVVKLARGLAVVVGSAAMAAVQAESSVVAPGWAVAAGAIGLRTLDAVTDPDAWEWKIGLRGRDRPSDQSEPARRALAAVNGLLDHLKTAYGRNILLLVDGLDRIQSATTFEDLFVESSLLADLRCQAVVTMHQGLSQQYRARLRGYRVVDFTHVPVVLSTDPSAPDPEGVAFFRGLADRRFRHLGIPSPIPVEQIDVLAESSGGRVRDFVTLIREVAVEAMLEDVATVGPTQVDRAIDGFRRDRESGLNAGHIKVLRGVRDDPDHRLPAGDMALDLLDRQLLLAYPNESLWYLPHPILSRLLR